MTPLFADALWFLALINARDAHHRRVAAMTAELDRPLLTTAWVLTEVLDTLCHPMNRSRASAFARDCATDDEILVVPPSQALFDAGLRLYADRPDKDWSLTDCISFVVMREHHVTEALTADRHFEQAGFTILLH